MNLDRHNYEEYFILYMDNELSPADRRQLESFVALHPDLKEELDLLMQFKLEPDESIVFEAKDELLKNISLPVVNDSNYKAWLMLYLDNELTGTDKKLVEQFLSKSPEAQKEWKLLEKTRLKPETLVFADKSSLYRTEKVKRMPVRWYRVAAAAVLLLGIGLTTAILVNKKSGADKEIVKTIPDNKQNGPQVIMPEPKQDLVAENNAKENSQPEEQKLTGNDKVNNRVENKKPVLVIPATNEEVVALKENEVPNNNLPKPVENPYLQPKKATNEVANVNPPTNLPLKQPLTVSDVTNESASPYIKYASHPEIDNGEPDQTEGKKTKLRGLFRKVARTFEKRTNIAATDDENKLLVAGLAFKLK